MPYHWFSFGGGFVSLSQNETIPAEMRFHGKAREYNELVQMLYKIPSNTRVTRTEKDDARAFTGFAEHQANYNDAGHDQCFPYVLITMNVYYCNVVRRPPPSQIACNAQSI